MKAFPLTLAARTGIPAFAPLLPQLAPGIFLLLWSGGFVAGKVGVQYAEPFTLLTIRYVLVVAILTAVFLMLRPALPSKAKDWFHLVMVGLMIQAGYFCFCYAALSAGASAGTVALISSLQPILVALLAPLATGEGRVTLIRWSGFVLGLSGAALVISAKSAIEITSVSGIGFAAGCLVAITSGTLYEKRFGVRQHPITANLIQYTVGLAVTLPLAYGLETGKIEWSQDLIIVMAYLVLANSLFAVSLYLAMLRRGEASKVSTLFFLVPPVSAMLAWVFLREEMPLMGWAGMVLAAIGVALAVSKSSLIKNKETRS